MQRGMFLFLVAASAIGCAANSRNGEDGVGSSDALTAVQDPSAVGSGCASDADAGLPGPEDAGVYDPSPLDASVHEYPSPADGGVYDPSPADAGVYFPGPDDAGVYDPGPLDAGPLDAGVPGEW